MKRQQQQQQIITIQILAPTTITLQIFDECAESRNLKKVTENHILREYLQN